MYTQYAAFYFIIFILTWIMSDNVGRGWTITTTHSTKIKYACIHVWAIKNKILNVVSHHRSVGVGGKQLHVDHPVDCSLAVAVVVLTHLGLHFGWRFWCFFLTKRYKNSLTAILFFSVVFKYGRLLVECRRAAERKEGRRKKFRSNTVEARTPRRFFPVVKWQWGRSLYLYPGANLVTDVTSVCIFPPIGEHMTVAVLQCEVKGEVAFFFPAYSWYSHRFWFNVSLIYGGTRTPTVTRHLFYLKRQ